jgi:Cu-processing system permease protein
MMKVVKYVVYDVLRSKMVIAYALLLLLLCGAIYSFSDDTAQAVVSLLHLVLFVVPLISIVFGTIHYYNSREFIELLLAQPIRRNAIFLGEYGGLSVSLAGALLLGLGIPVLVWDPSLPSLLLLLVAVLETFIFTGLAFLASVRSRDKARGIGLALMLWFYFAILYDGLILLVLFYFSDYPLEQPVLVLTAFNPVDLARILVLLKLDTSALMGYTGALYQRFFGSFMGIAWSFGFLLLWWWLPVSIALRSFRKKDL